MSGFNTDLHRFGLDPESPPDQAQWKNLCRFIRAIVNNPMLNIGTENSEIAIPQERAAATAGASSAPEDKPFCFIFKDESLTKLRGGIVIGGATNYNVPNITLNLASAADNKLWLRVTFEANQADDVLLPGIDSITNITTGSGATVPDNELPTMADPTGKLYIVLGHYTGTAFRPHGCGNFVLNHCPGAISYYRTE